MVTQIIKIDLTKDIITDHIIFKQGEIGREIEFEVYNEGVAVDLDGYDVTFSVYKPDGNFVIISGTVDNDTVTIEETEQMTAVCGTGCFDLTLTKTNEVIYTFKGFVDIATPIVTRATVNSVSTVFGLVFPDDFQEKLTAGDNITIVDNVISATGGGGGSYTAGEYISILNNVIDVKSSLISTINGKADASDLSALATVVNGKADASDLSALANVVNGKADASDLSALANVVTGKQDKLTAGTGITIDSNNVISASGGGGGSSVNMLYCNMVKVAESIGGNTTADLTFWDFSWTGKTIKGFAVESVNNGSGTDVKNVVPTKFTKDSDGHPLITFLVVGGSSTNVGGIKGILFYE